MRLGIHLWKPSHKGDESKRKGEVPTSTGNLMYSGVYEDKTARRGIKKALRELSDHSRHKIKPKKGGRVR